MAELTAKVERTVDAAVAEVWKVLTAPGELSKIFMGANVKSDFKEGDPNHELRFTHFSPLTGQEDKPENYHVVSSRLNALGQQTQIELSQANVAKLLKS